MFCHHCGKELPDNAKFCSGCGAAVEETAAAEETVIFSVGESVPEGEGADTQAPAEAREEAAPAADAAPEEKTEISDPVILAGSEQSAGPVENEPILGGEKKKRRGGSLIILGAIAVVLVVLIVGAIKVLPSMFGGKGVYFYATEDGELMSLKKLKSGADTVELTDEGVSSLWISKDGKYIYFIEEDEDFSNSDFGALYRMETAKLGKKGAEPEKISAEVQRRNIAILDSGEAVYLKGTDGDMQLRFYNGKDSFKLASGVSSFVLNEKRTHAYFVETDPNDSYTMTLYRVELKQDSKKEKLLSGADTIYSAYSDDMLVYGKYTDEADGLMDIYVAKPGEKGEKVLDDVANVFNVDTTGGKVSFSFMTGQTEEHTLYDFVTDQMASSDANEREPDADDYSKYYQYSYGWGWWGTDWDAYNAALEVWYEVRNRINIREDLMDTEYDITTYTLSFYDSGKVTKLAEGIDSSYINSDAESKVYLYSKTSRKTGTVADVSELGYYSEIYDLLDSGERQWYQNVGGTEREMDIDDTAYIDDFSVLNGKEAIVVVDDGEEMVIRSYELGKNGLSFTGTVTDDEFGSLMFREDKNGNDALYYFTDMNKDKTAGELIRYVDGKKETVAKDAERVMILEDGAVFKVEDGDYDSRSGVYEGTLYAIQNGKSTKIDDEVWQYQVTFMNAKKVVYISDGDLYVWNGSEREKIASDVVSFWTNEGLSGAEIRTFVCGPYYY